MSSLFGTKNIESVEEMAKDESLQRLFLLDDIMNESEAAIKEFCDSAEGQVMMEKANLDKKVVSRATVRKMDLRRRIKLTAYSMAKANNDPNWAKLVKFTKLKKFYANKLLAKYGTRAEKVAKIAQKNYIRTHKDAEDK
jgi:hypothetical protein